MLHKLSSSGVIWEFQLLNPSKKSYKVLDSSNVQYDCAKILLGYVVEMIQYLSRYQFDEKDSF